MIEPTLNFANKFVTGDEFIPEQINTRESGIAFHLKNPGEGLNPVAKLFRPMLLPKNINPGKKENYRTWDTLAGFAHRNSLGITETGRFAIDYMIQKGFLIDIDHMSEKMADVVLDIAIKNDYPVNSGHSAPRGNTGNENGRTLKQYAQLKQIGGMVGMGHGDNASDFVIKYREVAQLMDYSHLAIGMDVGEFSALPQRNTNITVIYDNNLKRCTTGKRTLDITTDGFAHYGLFPDYIKSWEVAGMTVEEKDVFMKSAEHFTRMWEKCEGRKKSLEKF